MDVCSKHSDSSNLCFFSQNKCRNEWGCVGGAVCKNTVLFSGVLTSRLTPCEGGERTHPGPVFDVHFHSLFVPERTKTLFTHHFKISSYEDCDMWHSNQFRLDENDDDDDEPERH